MAGYTRQSSATGTSGGTFIPITDTSAGIGNSTNEFYNGTFRIFNFNQAIRSHLHSEATYQDLATTFAPFRGYGETADASAFNAFRILPSSGTITVTYLLEGIRG